MAAYALIAEFDRQQTEVYRKSVEQQGVDAVIVRDGDAARRVLQARGAPILLICDLSLPQADGFSVIAELRRTWPAERTAILVFSAHAALRAAAWNLRNTLGIAGVADKNLLPDTIAETVARTLSGMSRIAVKPSPSRSEHDLLQNILFRIARALHNPLVLLSIELRDHRRVAGHLALDEQRDGWQIWPVLQQVALTREPLVVPNVAKHSLFGIVPQAPTFDVQAFSVVPLVTSTGRAVGVLGLLDFKPQALGASQLDLLLTACRRIADELANFYKDTLAEAEGQSIWRSKEEWAALERLALTDRLTGLSNRHAGEQALDREMARARRTGALVSLALLDLDGFKQVNDRYGHATGDEILKQVSRILRSTFRASDLAVRWGGDEFLVLLPDVPASGALVFAERARSLVETLVFPGVHGLTISAGIVQLRRDEDTREAVRRADAQLYEAKRLGRNLVRMAPAVAHGS